MPKFNVSDDEVIALGKKLDEFSEVLTEKERAMLLAMIRAAGKEFKALGTSTPTTTPPKSSLPPLGSAFDAAFIPARASEFFDESDYLRDYEEFRTYVERGR